MTEIQSDTPIAWWRLAETAVVPVVDATGHGHVGEYEGTPSFSVAGALANDSNTAVTFQGPDVFVDDPASAAYNVASLSVELWLKTTSAASMGVIGRWNNNSGAFQYRIRLANGVLTWQLQTINRGSCSGGGGLTATRAINDGTYHHVVATYDSALASMRIFIDGVEDRSGMASGSSLCPVTTFAIFKIAAVPLSFDSNFTGTLDEVAIYGSPLPASRVSAHYHAGIGN